MRLAMLWITVTILATASPQTACGDRTGPVKPETATSVSAASTDSNGFLVHKVRSPYQAGTTLIRVLLPEKRQKTGIFPVVYVLPVESGTENRYGDGLKEIRKLDLHNKRQTVFVAPTFSHLPWYADHPTDPEIRQESYLLKVVIPFIEKNYPVRADTGGRLLLGFSKSGWGAYSLLLRHPKTFGKAAAWDAPLMMDRPGKYGSGPIFGTEKNFSAYRVSTLLEANAAKLMDRKRLILLGHGNFRGDHQKTHELMEKLKIAHEYRDGPQRKHDWHSGWVKEAVELLLGDEEAQQCECLRPPETKPGAVGQDDEHLALLRPGDQGCRPRRHRDPAGSHGLQRRSFNPEPVNVIRRG